MGDKTARLDRVERAMSLAHRGRPERDLPGGWQRRVMAEVRLRAAGARVRQNLERRRAAISGMMFRFAGAGALVALLLLVYSQVFGPDVEAQAAGLALSNPTAAQVLASLL